MISSDSARFPHSITRCQRVAVKQVPRYDTSMVDGSEATKPARGAQTAAKLVQAASEEFNASGYHGTDTNRIARRAGFAPQTFYRWFSDKMEIFLAVYRQWEEDERADVETLLGQASPPERLASTLIAHHRKFKIFRRSLRLLSLEDERARKARAESRLRQMARFRATHALAAAPDKWTDAELAAWLLQFERLCDAAAENEFTDMKIKQRDALAQVAQHAALLWPEDTHD